MISFAKSFAPDERVSVGWQMKENIRKIYAKASNQKNKEIIEQFAKRAGIIVIKYDGCDGCNESGMVG
jgi:hypothetical protein